MKNLYGITDIRTKGIRIQTSEGEKVMMNEVNAFLAAHDGNIIDINFVSQALGQVLAVVNYKEEKANEI